MKLSLLAAGKICLLQLLKTYTMLTQINTVALAATLAQKKVFLDVARSRHLLSMQDLLTSEGEFKPEYQDQFQAECDNFMEIILDHQSFDLNTPIGEFFPVTHVSRGDFPDKFDTTRITDEMMQSLSNRMGDDYCEQLFHLHLPMIAEDYNFPIKVGYVEPTLECTNCEWMGTEQDIVEVDRDNNNYCPGCKHKEWLRTI